MATFKAKLKQFRRKIEPAWLFNLRTAKRRAYAETYYDQDGLKTWHNHDFMKDPSFVAAYQRGVAAAQDYRFHWRVHVALWVARNALSLDGDFVECGVNRGFLSSAIMKHLDWNQTDRNFYLFDTFNGLVETQMSEEERSLGRAKTFTPFYQECYDLAVNNFAEWPKAQLVRGMVPETLGQVSIEKVAYLSIDMNLAEPEIAAIRYFWPKMVKGGFILMDDYGYHGYLPQKRATDHLAQELGFSVLSMPTGQGLIIKT